MPALPDLVRIFDDGFRRRVVERTELPGGVVVSTIWIDTRVSQPGFETAIIRGDDTRMVEHYEDEATAVVGHGLWASYLGE